MTEAPLVSVLVKAFNHAPCIRQTLDAAVRNADGRSGCACQVAVKRWPEL